MIGIFLSSYFVILVLNLISVLGKDLGKEHNLKKYGAIYSETNYKKHTQRKALNQYYIIIFLMRRLFYVFIILFIYKYPIMQQCFNIGLHTLTFIYDLIMRPYGCTLLGIMIYFYDFILVLIVGSLPLYMKFADHADYIGRIHIYILVSTLILSWLVIIGVNIRVLYLKFRKPTDNEILDQIISEINNSSTKVTGVGANIFTRVRSQMTIEPEQAPVVQLRIHKKKILVRTFNSPHRSKKKKPVAKPPGSILRKP